MCGPTLDAAGSSLTELLTAAMDGRPVPKWLGVADVAVMPAMLAAVAAARTKVTGHPPTSAARPQ